MESKVKFCRDGVVMVDGVNVGRWESIWYRASRVFRFTPNDNHPDNGAGRTSQVRKYLAAAAIEALRRKSWTAAERANPLSKILLFGGVSYYACGGWKDLINSFDTLENAKAVAVQKMAVEDIQWWHAIDLETGKCLEADGYCYGDDGYLQHRKTEEP